MFWEEEDEFDLEDATEQFLTNKTAGVVDKAEEEEAIESGDEETESLRLGKELEVLAQARQIAESDEEIYESVRIASRSCQLRLRLKKASQFRQTSISDHFALI